MKCISLLVVATVAVSSFSEGELCPPWFVYDSNITIHSAPQQYSHCVCGKPLPFQIACNAKDYNSSLLSGNCAFWDNRIGRTVVGHCPYIFPRHLLDGRLIRLPQDVLSLNSWLCSHLHRERHDTVCGRCTNGTGPSVNSLGSQCVSCSPVNILYYILLHYLPATVIFLLILIAQVDITSTPMVYYILYTNGWTVFLQTLGGFSMYAFAFAAGDYSKYILAALYSPSSLWSLDPLHSISPPLCISPHLHDIDIQYFQILKTLYPFLLLLLAYVSIELHARDFKPVVILWRPIYRNLTRLKRSWNPHVSLVQAFATIFFISFLRLLSLVFVPFTLTNFIDDHGEYVQHSTVTYTDPTVSTGGTKHIYLIVVSTGILVFIILPPIVVLTTYPSRLFRKLQGGLSPRVNLALKIFVSTYQGWYKDGTDGTRDYRFLSGTLFLAFLIVMAIQMLPTFSNKTPLIPSHTNIIIFLLFTTLVAVLRPHKSEIANTIGICIGAMLTLASTLHVIVATYLQANTAVIYSITGILSMPHVVFYGYVMYRIGSKLGFRKALAKCCRAVKSKEMEEQAIINLP